MFKAITVMPFSMGRSNKALYSQAKACLAVSAASCYQHLKLNLWVGCAAVDNGLEDVLKQVRFACSYCTVLG
jgi:hypothetical protein